MITLKTLINNGMKMEMELKDKEIDSSKVTYIPKDYNNSKNKTPKDKFLKFIEDNIEVISGFRKDEETVVIDLYSFVEKNYKYLEDLFTEELKRSSFLKSNGLGIIDITDKMMSMIAGFGTDKFYEDFTNTFELKQKIEYSRPYNERVDNRKDFEMLVLLQNRILDLEPTNSDTVILLDQIDDLINRQIVNLQKEENISYGEWKKTNEKAKEKIKEESYNETLAEDRLNNLFENCNTKEIVEILYDFGFDKDYIVNQFIDIERIREATKVFNKLEEIQETLIYSRDVGNENLLYITKEDLEMIYGEENIERLSLKELETLSDNLIDKFLNDEQFSFVNDFEGFLFNYEAENGDLEEVDEESEEDER